MHKEYIKTMIQLATSGFGLVAALAWNSAIQELFKKVFGTANGNLISLFSYAIVITIIIVFVTAKLGKIAARVEKQPPEQR